MLAPGVVIGKYEVLEPIGEGGMGEVWKARDTTLEREVVLKTLPEALAHDTRRLARLEREARLLAALNHPNIAGIHGLERSDGTCLLELELVKGRTLNELVEAGPVAIETALKIAVQIAEALQAAHTEGIVHRDLKPSNVMLTPEGAVKLLDFGLAKTVSADSTPASHGLDATASVTREGGILGTPAYMSPEQIRSGPVDAQTDIWAFGCILFEMLAGESPFAQENSIETLGKALEQPPDFALLPSNTPPPVKRLIRRCLEKDPRDRLHHIGDARIVLQEALTARIEAPDARRPREKAEAAGGEPRRSPEPPVGRRWELVIIGFLAVALGYALWGWQNATDSEPVASARTTTEASVAVLPFSDISAAGDQGYFADGVSEEILNSLARIDSLQVAARTSSFYFKGRDADISTIGERLGVAHVLEGSVRKAGDNVRINVQLINAETGYHLWSETYNRRLEDIFAVQGDIAKGVADSLQITLGVGDLGRQPGMTRDVEAYDAFLEGRGVQQGEPSVESQITALERAVEHDSSFAIAWARLATVYGRVWSYDDPGNAAEWRRKAEQARARARELAPEAPQVMLQSANAAANRQEWLEADRLYRRALELHGDAARTTDFGFFLFAVGKAEDAIDHLTAARRVDPLSQEIVFQLGKTHAAAGEMQQALADFERAESLGPALPPRQSALVVALAMGDRAEIRRRFEALPLPDAGDDINVAMRKRLDDPEAALAELRQRHEEGDDLTAIDRVVAAFWAAYFGDPDLAWTIFEAAVPPGVEVPAQELQVFWDPLMSDVRTLPGFKDYVRDVGLVDYWRETDWSDFCRPVGEDDFECG